MYPSGAWRGFWQQEGFGRQPMEEFQLSFENGIRGRGVDVIGIFTISGECSAEGRVKFVKQYLGRHTVHYEGAPDGEGSILGTWHIEHTGYRGPFLLQPAKRDVSHLPIRDLA